MAETETATEMVSLGKGLWNAMMSFAITSGITRAGNSSIGIVL